MNLLSPIARIASALLGRRSSGYTGAGFAPSAPILSGTFVTPETAIGVAAVFSAINVISRDIAVLPCNVNRILPGGGWEVERSGQLGELNELLSVQPNSDMNAFRYRQDTMGHVLGRGNGFSEIVRKKGFPVALQVLHPAKTAVKRSLGEYGKPGRLYYELDNQARLDPDDVLHFAGLGFNGVVGYPPLTLMRQTIGISIAAEQFGASMFGHGAFASGWLKTPKKLGMTGVTNLRSSFNQIHQGSQSAHKIGILEEGMDFIQNQITPEDAQMILTREFQVKDVARIFSIPPHKIGDYSESHLANVEEANLDYVSMTLVGWIAMLEAEYNAKLLTREQRATHSIDIDMSSYLRGNIQAQMNRIQTLRNAGALNADEIRAGQGMNPLPPGAGGDKYVVQSQYIELKQVGQIPPATAKPPGSPGAQQKSADFLGLEHRFGSENGVHQ